LTLLSVYHKPGLVALTRKPPETATLRARKQDQAGQSYAQTGRNNNPARKKVRLSWTFLRANRPKQRSCA